jgi:outer membrane biosynthesis protein TonB
VRVWFGADGLVKNVLIMQSLPFGLNYQAVAAANLMEFEPATRDGKPYAVIKTVEYMFTLI